MKKILLACTAISALAVASADAATVQYNLTTSGNWNVAGNWTNNTTDAAYPDPSVPFDPLGATDRVDARIGAGFSATVNSAVPTVDNLVVLNGGILNINSGASLSLNVDVLVRDASTVNHDGGTVASTGFLLGTNANQTGANYTLSGTGIVSTNAIIVGNSVGSRATFTITGNGATINNAGAYTVRNGGTQKFVFGTSGISTINATTMNLITADNITLTIDLSNLVVASGTTTTFKLIDGTNSLAVGETFSNTNILGLASNPTVQSAAVRYDTTNADVLLDVFAVPEPSTFAMLLGGLGMLTMLRRRRAA